MKIYITLLVSLLLNIYPSVILATDNNKKNQTKIELNGVIESFDLESSTITMNNRIFTLADDLVIYDTDKNLLNRSLLNTGQLISYTVDSSVYSNNLESHTQTISVIVIQSKKSSDDRLQ